MNEIIYIILSAIIGSIFGILMDEFFYMIQGNFVLNKTNRKVFCILQLITSIIILWFINFKLIKYEKYPLLSALFVTAYYNSQINLWDNLKSFKYTNA